MASRLFDLVIIHVSPRRASSRDHIQPAPGSEPLPGSHAYANARIGSTLSAQVLEQSSPASQPPPFGRGNRPDRSRGCPEVRPHESDTIFRAQIGRGSIRCNGLSNVSTPTANSVDNRLERRATKQRVGLNDVVADVIERRSIVRP